uniref:EPS8 signaling adaptor L3a n=1 Tax=Amphilophus citrinellus TaxID=61819 RepID=A0A3Q0SLG0_AMPCI
QRQEYAASINKMMDRFQCRVEHLITCDLDGKELRNTGDCVERLNLLNEMGHVWGQNMILEVQDTNLLLTDIENKELELIPLSDIREFKALLDAGVFKSLLTVSVQPRRKRDITVFMFQCEDVRMEGMPSQEEFEECLHKFKFGFNLLGALKGKINNPSAPEYVHSLFTSLKYVVSHCPEDLPPTIVAPLLTPQCIRLMSEEATTEEDELWQSLGDAWNIPSTQWPEDDEDIPTYTPQFFDGWQPPEVTAEPAPSEPVTRQKMRVRSDFISRNDRELTLLDKSKQWWKVRNDRGEEGFVPNNILQDSHEQSDEEEIFASPVLTKRSKPAEVKAWLEDKGFSKTVRCLGVLSGITLLGMTREELKTVCPEEGGRVFFQLQAVRSQLAAAS